MRAFSRSPGTIETDLLPAVTLFKELIDMWQSSPTLHSLLRDQKAALLSQLQQVILEAKKAAAGSTSSQPIVVVSCHWSNFSCHLRSGDLVFT